MSRPDLVVLAAGLGTRYGGLKQLVPIGPGGATVLDYTVYDALRTGFGAAVLVIRDDMEAAVRATIGARWDGRVALSYAHQRLDDLPPGVPRPPSRVKPWGTAHAVRAARSLVHGPFAVANADDFYRRASLAALARFLAEARESAPPTYALVGYRVRDTLSPAGGVSRAVCRITDDGWLEAMEELHGVVAVPGGARGVTAGGENRMVAGNTIVSMNLWGFTPAIFEHIEEGLQAFLHRHADDVEAEYLLPALVADLVEASRARVRVLPSDGPWGGVTHPEDAVRAAALLRRLVAAGEYPAVPWG